MERGGEKERRDKKEEKGVKEEGRREPGITREGSGCEAEGEEGAF